MSLCWKLLVDSIYLSSFSCTLPICLLTDVSKPFTFRGIVDFVGFKSVFLLFVFCLIPVNHLIITFSLSPACGLFEHFLEIYFDLFSVFEYINLYSFLSGSSRYYNIRI